MVEHVGHSPIEATMNLIRDRDWLPLMAMTERPETVQHQLLSTILSMQRHTQFGQRHGFASIRSYQDFVQAVPILEYEDLRRDIETQEVSGEPLLNAERPVHYVQTSGTTGKPKYVPLTHSAIEWIGRYQRLFSYAQWSCVPKIYDGQVLVIAGQSVEGHMPGGTPYGSMSGLMNEKLPPVVLEKGVLPRGILHIGDVRLKYMRIAACALAAHSLSVLATPNPSTILRLLEIIRSDFSCLLEALTVGPRHPIFSQDAAWTEPVLCPVDRLAYLRTLLDDAPTLSLASLWPTLRAVITWMGGNCAVLIPKLRSLLSGETAVIEMGYLSSECLGSLNVEAHENRCIPTFQEHFFEFIEVNDSAVEMVKPVLLGELQPGKKYQVLVTTRSGLYRYAMNDIVEATGRFNRVPTIRFVQKGKGVTSITGEKLYEHQVVEALETVLRARGIVCEFYVMLADVHEAAYTLYLEQPAVPHSFSHEVDEQLARLNVEYRAKRESGRLQALRVALLRAGTAEAYRCHSVAKGQRDAQFKLMRLQYRHDCSFDFLQYLR
ncbi:MAG: GH3 auxin-responsive promoter family protein [Nitrospira sp.]|nr:GH3 auxin-responsive promoter family protein [Nitrospira sp.]MCP9461021.1 GH3 auxin-responsive promoter family protein [Nitrospira sp.]MCP9475311.1 GH3 auxin-responsive promoter family protein [Nitrospira sp.]